MYKTKLRLRSEPVKYEVKSIKCVESIRSDEYFGTPVDLPVYLPCVTNCETKEIIDEVIDFDGTTREERSDLIDNHIHNRESAWNTVVFKYCKNTVSNCQTFYVGDMERTEYVYVASLGRNVSVIADGQTSLYTDTYCSSNILQGSSPLDFIRNTPEFSAVTQTSDIDFRKFLMDAQQDAALLGTETFSVANFIAELRDLISVVGFFKDKIKSNRDLAGKYLGLELGIKPLLGDLSAIYSIFTSLDHKIEQWNNFARSGTILNNHKSAGKGDVIPLDFTIYGERANTVHYDIKCDVSFKTHYHLYYKAVPLSPLAEGELLRSLLGLGNVGSIIWEAIPFSFVVDYVYNVGDLIEHFTNSDPILQMEIETLGYSVKDEIANIQVDTHLDTYGHRYYGDVAYPMKISTAFGNIITYERKKIDADILPVLEARDIGQWTIGSGTAYHTSIVAALFIAK